MTTTHEAKVALWHRLRDDPDYDPSWSGFMGHAPPKPPVEHYRVWGDGATDEREHVIDMVSYRVPLYVSCRCGVRVEATSNVLLEDLWSLHRGLLPEEIATSRMTADAAELATNAEVSAFLGRAADPTYQFKADG